MPHYTLLSFTGFGVSIATCFLFRLYEEVPGSSELPQLLSTYRQKFLPPYLSQQLSLWSVHTTMYRERLWISGYHTAECHWLHSNEWRILLSYRLQLYILQTWWFENCRRRCLSHRSLLPREIPQETARALVVSLIYL